MKQITFTKNGQNLRGKKMTKKVRFNNWTISKWRSGRMVCDVRSIGHKWVWLKQINKKQYTKISRLEWNQITASKYFEVIE